MVKLEEILPENSKSERRDFVRRNCYTPYEQVTGARFYPDCFTVVHAVVSSPSPLIELRDLTLAHYVVDVGEGHY